MRAKFALWLGLRAEEKVGQHSEETAPFQSGQSYFFFAFLAFLAAFFAFFAIGPPEGVQLVPDGDIGCSVEPPIGVSGVHKPLSERSTLIPDVDYGRENCDVKHKARLLVKTLTGGPRLAPPQMRPWSQIARAARSRLAHEHARRARRSNVARRSLGNVGSLCECL
jgi:hypothetical protein